VVAKLREAGSHESGCQVNQCMLMHMAEEVEEEEEEEVRDCSPVEAVG
jgi:hypothetical protein